MAPFTFGLRMAFNNPARSGLALGAYPRSGVQGASLGIMRHWWFHRWGRKGTPPHSAETKLGPLRKAFFRPMLPVLIALDPGPRLGSL